MAPEPNFVQGWTQDPESKKLVHEGIWKQHPIVITLDGPPELAAELSRTVTTSDRSSLMLMPRGELLKLLRDNEGQEAKIKELEQRVAELTEGLRAMLRVKLTTEQKNDLQFHLQEARDKLLTSYGKLLGSIVGL